MQMGITLGFRDQIKSESDLLADIFQFSFAWENMLPHIAT